MSCRPSPPRPSSRNHDGDGKIPTTRTAVLPSPVGPLSRAVADALTTRTGTRTLPDPGAVDRVDDPLADLDLQLALWMLYQLHADGFQGIDSALEWDPELLAVRRSLEHPFEQAARSLVRLPDPLPTTAAEVTTELTRMTIGGSEPPLAAFLAREASREQFVAFLTERAVYHLHEADAQCFLLARLRGPAKTALAEIQYDEFGAGRPERLHARIYADGLAQLGLPTDPAAYVDGVGARTLASINVTTMFNVHRRLRGAAAGHFAAFEATSSIPCRLIAQGAQRLGLPTAVVDYFTEHVEADAVHEQVAITDLCGSLVAAEPELAADVMLGAAACLALDELAADALLDGLRSLPTDDDRIAS